VTLPAHGVKVELTATQRVAMHRYTFNTPGRVQLLVDLQHGLRLGEGPRVLRARAEVVDTAGEVQGTVWSRNRVEREASFVLRFDHAIERVITLAPRAGDKAPRYVLGFNLGRTHVLQARVALSTVDVPGARRNLVEASEQSFDQVRREARKEWNALLSRITIDAPAQQQRIFYSALYRTLLHPSDIADADGRVRGPTGVVTTARGGVYYSSLSLWATFRATHPLYTLIVPERVGGFVDTLLQHHEAQGYLPLWTAWGREAHSTIGNPALPMIADAVAKGFAGFDPARALEAMVRSSTEARPRAPEWAQREWSDYMAHGFVPFGRVAAEAVSRTLDYGIGDDAVARVARAAGDEKTAHDFELRALGYRRLWDSATQTMRGKDSQGRWRTPFDPLEVTSPMRNPGDYFEANAWQATLTPALHDPAGLVDLMGGPAALETWLDRFFATRTPGAGGHRGQEAVIGQYAHGDATNHHAAWLYAYTPSPWKGQALVRRIATRFYREGSGGIVGHDGGGQMSAWLVFATLGLYPAVPASARFVWGAPLVRAARVQLTEGKVLRIKVRNFDSPWPWASAISLDGKPQSGLELQHAALARGGMLEFTMSPVP
jgi:predicted alpha-1,2-mannosidase